MINFTQSGDKGNYRKGALVFQKSYIIIIKRGKRGGHLSCSQDNAVRAYFIQNLITKETYLCWIQKENLYLGSYSPPGYISLGNFYKDCVNLEIRWWEQDKLGTTIFMVLEEMYHRLTSGYSTSNVSLPISDKKQNLPTNTQFCRKIRRNSQVITD